MTLPLDGITVLDFSTLLPGPLATFMLAEAGAEVIKVERPGGEDMRAFPPRLGTGSAAFAVLNAGKTSIVADLKTAEGRAKLRPLTVGPPRAVGGAAAVGGWRGRTRGGPAGGRGVVWVERERLLERVDRLD